MSVRFLARTDGPPREGTSLADGLAAVRDPAVAAWLDLESPTPEEIAALAQTVGLHEITVEELQSQEGGSRMEEFDDHAFLLFQSLRLQQQDGDPVTSDRLCFLLTKSSLVTVHRRPLEPVTRAFDRVRRDRLLLAKGVSFVQYLVLDSIVDAHFLLLDRLEDDVEGIEDTIMNRFDRGALARVLAAKKALISLRRRVSAQRDVLQDLWDRPHPLIPARARAYYRQLYEHLARIDARLGGARDLLQGVQEAYLAQETRATNETVKTLSVLAAALLPLHVLTGLYGTNFHILPGADSPSGFWIFVASLGALGLGTAWYFRRKGWF